MKKVTLIVLTVAVLIGITIYADKATRVSGAGGVRMDSKVAGKPEPELKLKTVDGKDFSLADYKGKVVFVNRLTWMAGKLAFLNSIVLWLERSLTGAK